MLTRSSELKILYKEFNLVPDEVSTETLSVSIESKEPRYSKKSFGETIPLVGKLYEVPAILMLTVSLVLMFAANTEVLSKKTTLEFFSSTKFS